MPTLDAHEADAVWPCRDVSRTVAAWLWMLYFLAEGALALWLLR